MAKKQFKDIDLIESERLREVIGQKLTQAMLEIDDITGYYSDCTWDILEDTVAKSVQVDLSIALLARPHGIDERKVKHYITVNPHNCLNEPILVFKYNNWYEIYNGVHRTEANRKLGEKTIKATIITADKETLEKRKLLK
jgi:hypothetical protein